MGCSPEISPKTATNADIGVRIATFLDANHVMSLATYGPQGPHAASLFYVRDGFALLWVSDPNSQHSLDLTANHRVAATVAPDCRDFNEVCGAQICGDADRVRDPSDCHHARALLATRYAFLKRLSDAPPAVKQAYESAELYRLDPRRIVLIDNKQGFGHKDILDLKPLD